MRGNGDGPRIDVSMLRTRVEAAALRARRSDIKARQRGDLLEEILQAANPPLFHYLSISLEDGQRVADVMVAHIGQIRDLIVVPLQRMIEWETRTCEGAGESKAGDQDREKRGVDENEKGSAPEAASGTKDQGRTTAHEEPSISVEAGREKPEALEFDDLDEVARSVLKLIGQSGEFLVPPLLAAAADLPWAERLIESSRQTRLYEALNALEEAGWIAQKRFDLRLGNRARRGVGSRTVELTGAGRAAYRERVGGEPLDRLTRFAGKYKTVEAGLLIRRVKEILQDPDQRDFARWNVDVIDAVWEPDEAFERIPGARRSYHAGDGSTYALPDLILQMRPPGAGKPVLAVVEVERGKYKLADLRAKWERALRCYPPRMIYVVAPNTSTRDSLRREWKTVLGKVKARYGLPEGADAAFYTVEELVTVGLLSPRQLTKLVFRQRHAREKGEALSPQDAVDLPPFWCEKKSRKKGKQRELGLG